jgi:DNA-directed RNA polymerase III subunit RPC4
MLQAVWCDPSCSQQDQSSPSERGRGRGRGGDRGRGRGTSFTPVEMTASGPFALGPGEGSGRRAAPSMRLVYGASGPAAIGGAGSSSHTGLHVRSLLSRADRLKAEEEDPEQYSDPDEPNMEIVDLSDVKALDWMAPDTLRRIKPADRNAKGGKMKMKKIEEPIGEIFSYHFWYACRSFTY